MTLKQMGTEEAHVQGSPHVFILAATPSTCFCVFCPETWAGAEQEGERHQQAPEFVAHAGRVLPRGGLDAPLFFWGSAKVMVASGMQEDQNVSK